MAYNGFETKAAALRHLSASGFKIATLLAAPESNPKVAKNGKLGVMTAPLHLAPYNLSGFNVCAQASKGCIRACLHTAGNPAYMEQKEKSRLEKTRAYFKARDAFMALLAFEIDALVRKAHKAGMEPGVRLNATSDLPWEVREIEVDGRRVKLMDHFRHVQFYDYTKITKRALAWANGYMPKNYHLTFSKTEDNDPDVWRVLTAGGNVAIVFSRDRYRDVLTKGRAMLPDGDWPVTDGDAHDFRPVDPVGVVVALKAKGDARQDTSGFVVA